MAKILCRRQICMNFCPVCELSEQISKQTNCNLRSLRRERKHLSTETEIRMTEYGTGCLVRSLAGHDKGTYYIIVREDGEVLCYHLFNRNEFETYLINNTKFETASTSRHEFGSIYKDNGKYYIKLNLQVRFIK